MNNNLLTLASLFGAILAVVGLVIIMPKLSKKNINLQPIFDETKDILNTSKKALNVIDEVVPNNPAVKTLEFIERWGEIAAGNSEQLYHSNDIDKDARKEVAQNVAYSMLKELGLDVTDNRKALIDAAINNAVDGLGHKAPDEAAKEAAHQELQLKYQKQVEESARLNQIINQIQGTVSSVQ